MANDAKLFGDTDDAALFGDAPKKKQTDPRSQRMSKDPARKGQPEGVQEENERLGLDTGGIKTLRIPGIGATMESVPEPIGNAAKQAYVDEAVGGAKRIEGTLASTAAGGVLGKAAQMAMAAKLAPAAAPAIGEAAAAGGSTLSRAIGSITGALKHSTQAALLGAVVGGQHGHGIGAAVAGAALPIVLKGAAAAAPAVGRGAAAIAPAVGQVVGGATGAQLPTRPEGPALPSTPEFPETPAGPQSSLHNAIDRLRTSTNPRAAELLQRIEAARQTPMGTVTQSTGVA